MVYSPQYLYTTKLYGVLVVNMPVGEYRGISIRKEVYESVQDFISRHPEMGYRNVAQFVTDAVREKLIELNTQLTNSEIKKKAEVAQE